MFVTNTVASSGSTVRREVPFPVREVCEVALGSVVGLPVARSASANVTADEVVENERSLAAA